MKKSKERFTPGPWQASEEKCWFHVASFFPVTSQDGQNVIAVTNSLKKHDANIIACAPEMYALLKVIQGKLRFCELESAIDANLEHKIDALLAKARGEVAP